MGHTIFDFMVASPGPIAPSRCRRARQMTPSTSATTASPVLEEGVAVEQDPTGGLSRRPAPPPFRHLGAPAEAVPGHRAASPPRIVRESGIPHAADGLCPGPW